MNGIYHRTAAAFVVAAATLGIAIGAAGPAAAQVTARAVDPVDYLKLPNTDIVGAVGNYDAATGSVSIRIDFVGSPPPRGPLWSGGPVGWDRLTDAGYLQETADATSGVLVKLQAIAEPGRAPAASWSLWGARASYSGPATVRYAGNSVTLTAVADRLKGLPLRWLGGGTYRSDISFPRFIDFFDSLDAPVPLR